MSVGSFAAPGVDDEIVVGRHDRAAAPTVAHRLAGAASGVGGAILRSRWTRVLGPLLVLGFWWLLNATGAVAPNQLPSPPTVWDSGVDLARDGTLTSAIGVSAQRVGLGLSLGLLIGVVLALLSGLSLFGERIIDAVMHMFRTMPVLALLPLFVIWFGIGEQAKVYLIAWAVIFPIYINLYAGIRGVDEKLVTAGRVLGLSRLGLIRHVIIPGALPQFLTGLRLALGVSWLVLVAAEQINATSGLGFLITNAQNLSDTPDIFVGLIVYAALGLGTDVLVRLIERWTLAWRSSFVTR